MNADEKRWCEDAMGLCEMATRKGLSIVMARMQDQNGEIDFVVTNVTASEGIVAMAQLLRAETLAQEDE